MGRYLLRKHGPFGGGFVGWSIALATVVCFAVPNAAFAGMFLSKQVVDDSDIGLCAADQVLAHGVDDQGFLSGVKCVRDTVKPGLDKRTNSWSYPEGVRVGGPGSGMCLEKWGLIEVQVTFANWPSGCLVDSYEIPQGWEPVHD